MNLTSEQRGFIAGFFEGEGSVRKRTESKHAQLQIMQVNRVPLDWIAEWSGVGKVYGPYQQKSRPTTQPYYVYSISKANDLKEFLDEIFPLLSPSRQERIYGYDGN